MRQSVLGTTQLSPRGPSVPRTLLCWCCRKIVWKTSFQMKSSGEFCALLLIAISLNNVLCFLLSPKCKLHGHRQGRSSVDMASEHSATYKTFLNEIAMTRAPERLDDLLELIELSGDEITGPTAGRVDLNPFLIPLAKSPKDGSLTCYIRWPTQKEDFDLQLVRTTDVGVTLLATGTSQYCHRLAVENQFYSRPFSEKSIEIINRNGLIYKSEDYMSYLKSGKFPAITEDDLRLVLDRYLLTKVGAFPDCYERLAANYFNNGDLVSAFVTCERAVSIFYGWGHPISFHATLMEKADRDKEAKDTARFAFGMPAWTIAKTQQVLAPCSSWI